jgi:LacI family transcriptional regulator
MWTIGLHMHIGLEQTRRIVDGVLKYVAEQPEVTLRDFYYPTNEIHLPEIPPWIGRADGVVANLSRVPGVVEHLRRGRVPVVNTSADMQDEVVSVFTDPKSLAKLAADHFLALNRRNIAYIGYRHADGSRDRCRALANVLRQHKLPLVEYQTDKRFTGTYEDYAALDELEPELLRVLRETAKPMAVLAMNDRWAASICRIVMELGFAIPDDVAVLGIEDFDVARLANPNLSSIRTDGEGIGYEATRLLHRTIRGERLARRRVAVAAREVVARESTVGKLRAPATDVDRALQYIRQKACEGIRIEDVANHVHMPLRTFELQFSAAVGHTVGEALRKIRLARTTHLLETTDMPLARVAHLVGLSSAPALVEYLRRWKGITPAQYRKRHRAT